MGDALAVVRYHIVLVAVLAELVFGWLMTGRYLVALMSVVALDWFLINLLNRVTDIDEDLHNNIRGTERVARHRRLVTVGSLALMVGSFVGTHLLWPQLSPWRAIVQAIGLGYNYRVVLVPRLFTGGWLVGERRGSRWRLTLSRFKEIYFFKNFGSSVIFVHTCFIYPLALAPRRQMPWGGVVALALFFVLFELTYEILYDLRDLEGDRAEAVPTYPVVHGPRAARRIIDGLLVGSTVALGAALVLGLIGLREGLMIVAPLVQWLFYRPRERRGLTARDCVALTHLGSGLLAFYLAGTALWRAAGLPGNIYLR